MTLLLVGAWKSNRVTDQNWHLLAEISLSLEPDRAAEVTIGLLKETLGDLRLLSLDVEKIRDSLAKSMVSAGKHGLHGESGLPLLIRVYAQRGSRTAIQPPAVDEAHLPSGNGMDSASDAILPAQRSAPAGGQVHQGWGHFTVERMVRSTGTAGETDLYLIEIFFYRGLKAD